MALYLHLVEQLFILGGACATRKLLLLRRHGVVRPVPAVGRALQLALTLFILGRRIVVLVQEGASLLRRLLTLSIQHVRVAILAREESALRHVRAFARVLEHAGAPLLGRGTLALGKEDDALLVHLRCRQLLSGQCLLELHLLLGALLLVR